MDADPTLKEDIELFRRVMRVMNVLQQQGSMDQFFPPAPSSNIQPNLPSSGPYKQQPRTKPREHIMADKDELSEEDDSSDDEDEDEEYDSDDDDDDENDYDSDEDEDDGGYDEEDESDSDEEEGHAGGSTDDGDRKINDLRNYLEERSLFRNHLSTLPSKFSHSRPPSHQQQKLQNLANQNTRTPIQSNTDTGNKVSGPAAKDEDTATSSDADLRCWDHGCAGRKFTTRSNLRRHRKEKSPQARPKCRCPKCGAVFSRTTARNVHVARRSCNRIRRYSNGRVRPNAKVKENDGPGQESGLGQGSGV